MIPDSVLTQIRERVDIVELINSVVPLKRAGKNFKGNCPFHNEKSPSFMVNVDKQIFHCFGCGAGGNIFTFIMKVRQLDFRQAAEMLADQAGIEIPKDSKVSDEAQARSQATLKANEMACIFYHNFLTTSKDAAKAREYFKQRGIDEKIISTFKLGYAPETWDAFYQYARKDLGDAALDKSGLVLSKKEGSGFYDRFRARVIFPILGEKGQCVAFGARVLDASLPKYLNSPETDVYVKGRNLYGLYQAKAQMRQSDMAVVVEGYMDLIACHQAGVGYAVASLGTALTTDQIRLIKKHTHRIYMLYDGDSAGQNATARSLDLILEEGLEAGVIVLADGQDPDSFVRQYGVEAFLQRVQKPLTVYEYRLMSLKKQLDATKLEGRVKIAGQMAQMFAKIKNEILRAAWIKALSVDLGLDEQAIANESKKAGSGLSAVSAAPIKQAKVVLSNNEISLAEKLMLGLMLDSPFYVQKAKENIEDSDFLNEKARLVARRIMDMAESSPSAADLMNVYAQDPELSGVVALACSQAEEIVDKKKTFEDCLQWFRKNKVDIQRKTFQVELQEAQKSKDRDKVQQLLKNLNELNKGNKRS